MCGEHHARALCRMSCAAEESDEFVESPPATSVTRATLRPPPLSTSASAAVLGALNMNAPASDGPPARGRRVRRQSTLFRAFKTSGDGTITSEAIV